MPSGSCLCGAVTFSLDAPAEATFTCFCLDCRKNSGHLGQAIAKMNTSDMKINDPESQLKEWTIAKTQSGYPKNKVFCGRCGCTMWTQPMKYNREKSMVRITLLDDGVEKYLPKKVLFQEAKSSYLQTPCEFF
uniref:ARAD1D06446p n=1 Tax=Blastobotrys adeninivorans TaxID=409370 RepID=A0A060T7Z5_BLAAD